MHIGFRYESCVISLAHPGDMSGVNFRFGVFGDGKGWLWEGAIKKFKEVIPNEGCLNLEFPGHVICRVQFENVVKRNNNKWGLWFRVVGNDN